MARPTWQRYLAKTVSWRIVATVMLLLISLAFSQSIVLASSIALVNLIINSVLYLIHDYVWDRVRWGWNKENPDYPLTAKEDDVASTPNQAHTYPGCAKDGEATHEHSSS